MLIEDQRQFEHMPAVELGRRSGSRSRGASAPSRSGVPAASESAARAEGGFAPWWEFSIQSIAGASETTTLLGDVASIWDTSDEPQRDMWKMRSGGCDPGRYPPQGLRGRRWGAGAGPKQEARPGSGAHGRSSVQRTAPCSSGLPHVAPVHHGVGLALCRGEWASSCARSASIGWVPLWIHSTLAARRAWRTSSSENTQPLARPSSTARSIRASS